MTFYQDNLGERDIGLTDNNPLLDVDQRNSMAQHLTEHHPAQKKNKDAFSFKVVTTGERPLTRQLREAQRIANDIPSGQLINGRNEHIAPAFQQMAPTDILGRDRNNGR